MKRLLLLLSAFTLVFALAACDVVDEPYYELRDNNLAFADQSSSHSKTSATQRVLVEDYTGFNCGNCPRAGESLKELQEDYPDDMVPLAVHAGFFATPQSNQTLDLRTPDGNELDAHFQNSMLGLPNGLVNRAEFNGRTVLNHDDWRSALVEQLDQTPAVDLEANLNYNANTRQVETTIHVDYVGAGSADHRLVVYLVENNIIGYQKDYSLESGGVYDYNHSHVLRNALNSIWGAPISSTDPAPGERYTYAGAFTVAETYEADNCELVIFVQDHSSRRVLNAIRAPLASSSAKQ